MKFSTLLPLSSLLAVAVADSASIISSIQSIGSAALTLNDTVGSWDGGIFGLVPVLIDTSSLFISIHNGTETAINTTTTLTLSQGAQVAAAVSSMVVDYDLSLTTLIDSQSKFANFSLGPTVMVSLVGQKYELGNLTDALVDVVPTTTGVTIQAAFAGLGAALDLAIVDYAKDL